MGTYILSRNEIGQIKTKPKERKEITKNQATTKELRPPLPWI